MTDDTSSNFLGSLEGLYTKISQAIGSNFDAASISSKIYEVDDAAVQLAKSFGQGRENVLGMSRAMAGAVREVTLLGGSFQNIADIQKTISEGLGRNLVLTTDSYERLYAAQEVSGQSAKTIAMGFKDAGFSIYQSATQMENVINVSRQLGANAQAVSGVVLENMNALNKFTFDGGVQGLAKMAAQATMLRVDMRETLNLAEKVFDPEGAIEVAAAMQRLGVANSELLDPLRLMDMAQNDPTELQNQLVKMTEQFVTLNEKGQFEILPGAKRQIREISSALNIPYETLTKMAIGSKELDEKLRQISFAGFNFTEEQQRMIAGMAEMGEGGEFKISMNGVSTNLEDAMTKIAGMGEDERKKFFESTQPKTLEDLAEKQLTVLEQINANFKSMSDVTGYAMAGTQIGKDSITAMADITREISNVVSGAETLSIPNLTRGIDEVSTKVFDSINDLLTGEGSIEDVIQNMGEIGNQFSTGLEKVLDETSNNYVESMGRLDASNNMFIRTTMNGIDFIKGMLTQNGLNNNTNNSNNNSVLQVQDFVIKALPQDEIRIVGGTNLDGNNNQQNNTMNSSPTDVNVNLKIDINAPANIDTAQLVLALQNSGVREAIEVAVLKARTGDNQNTITPNRQRQMVMTNNAMGITGIPVT
jgi:hypothetical protein